MSAIGGETGVRTRRWSVMKTRQSALVVVAGLLVGVVCRDTDRQESPLLDGLLGALDRVLQFLMDHPDHLVEDTLFGVILAEGQLKVLLRHIADNDWAGGREGLVDKLQELCDKCRRLLSLIEPRLLDQEMDQLHQALMEQVLRPELWLVDRPFRRYALWTNIHYMRRSRFMVHDAAALSAENYGELLSSGYPNETVSDHCIFELVTPHGANASDRCHVSPECWYLETSGPRPSGYPLTHRLLFLQIARQTGCEGGPFFSDLNQRVEDLCSEILFEAETLDLLGVPPIVVDLFLEQVTLCGMEGFMEFTRPDWLERIVSLQRSPGCYGDMEVEERDLARALSDPRTRAKREDGVMEFNCMMHVTGLAAAALATGARSLVKAAPMVL